MPKTRPPYAPEFRQQMVDLDHSNRDPTDLSRKFEPSAQAFRNWIVEADRRDGRREPKPVAADPALTLAERDELARLRRENKQLRLERRNLSREMAGRGAQALRRDRCSKRRDRRSPRSRSRSRGRGDESPRQGYE